MEKLDAIKEKYGMSRGALMRYFILKGLKENENALRGYPHS
ncbi:MAG: hypothetical protein JXC33_07975 [Deltaproteobacteria bacterium]|nr:hypothetical protein [Deltaproteobacteria bacterium]